MRSDHHISEIIRLASIVSILLPLGIYLVKSRYATRAVHVIGMLAILSAASDFAGYFLSAHGKSTVVLFNTYYVVLFGLLSWFYYLVTETRSARTIVQAGAVIYAILFVIISVYEQSFMQYQTLMWTITGMAMIFFSISYFIHLFAARNAMTNFELLWINSGILLYFSLNLFLFVMSDYVLTKLDPEISVLIWGFHNVNNIMKNVLFGCGLYAFSKERSVSVNMIQDPVEGLR
jgi:hypothetical protein